MIRPSGIMILFAAALAMSLAVGCSHNTTPAASLKPTAFGAAIVETSGGKQITQTGTPLPQPISWH